MVLRRDGHAPSQVVTELPYQDHQKVLPQSLCDQQEH
jgi:hypothetical protein